MEMELWLPPLLTSELVEVGDGLENIAALPP